MKSKSKKGLYTFEDVQKRKLEILEELEICEANIQESFYNFTHPTFFVSKFWGCGCDNEDASPLEAIGNIAQKAKTVISIVGTAMSVYNLIKKFRTDKRKII